MASKALCTAILAGALCYVLAAPTFDSAHYCLRQENIDPPPQLQIKEIDALLLTALDTSSQALSTTLTITEGNQYPFSFSYITSPVSNPSVEQTTTVTIIMDEPTTITVPAEPKTITEFITITPSSSSVPPPTPSRSPLNNDVGPPKAVWVAPGNMSDLSSFHVSKYAGGKQNMKVVTGIPAKASATSKAGVAAAAAVAADPSLPQWDNASAALQLLFPENSIDPANEPQGGADFYAAPIDISDARNVTLRYSVFFPADFDWVLAGKLPGLYGGHTGCSGGNAALDCFSTRLMWRQNGAGELYLYAPKDKQTKDLCDDPQSVCDAAYGLSVGRGSFSWTAGSWTTIEQTVSLNTPGRQDGGFALNVNGVRVIDRNDVFYRDNLGASGSGKARKPTKTRITHALTKTTSRKHTTSTSTSSDDGGLLGPILSGILGGIIRRDGGESVAVNASATSTATRTCQKKILLPEPTPSNPQPLPTTATATTTSDSFGIQSATETEVKFVGIFFSTFFGGHEDRYATPRDQYAWFKDFALAYNE